jgi:hypothetical protein
MTYTYDTGTFAKRSLTGINRRRKLSEAGRL